MKNFANLFRSHSKSNDEIQKEKPQPSSINKKAITQPKMNMSIEKIRKLQEIMQIQNNQNYMQYLSIGKQQSQQQIKENMMKSYFLLLNNYQTVNAELESQEAANQFNEIFSNYQFAQEVNQQQDSDQDNLFEVDMYSEQYLSNFSDNEFMSQQSDQHNSD